MHFMILRIFCGDSQGNTQMLCYGSTIVVDLELTWQYPLNENKQKLFV